MKLFKQVKYIYLVLLFLASIFNIAVEAQNINEELLNKYIDSTMKQWNVPGLAVSIIKGGKVIYEKGFGFKNLDSKELITPQTLFYIASATKPFTSTLAAMLYEDKKLDFDSPVKKYVSDFNMFDNNAADIVTLRDMLSHRTGVPRQKFFTLNNINSRKEVRNAYAFFEPIMSFREGFQYCNENYTVAGDIISEISGDSWENLIIKRIFTPLEMNRSFVSKEDIKKENYASPYIDWGKGNEKMDLYDAKYLGAAGSIISNVQDLSKWVLFYLNRGKVNGKQIIKTAYLAQLLYAQTPTIPLSAYPELSFECYGLGWFLDYYRGHFHVHHGGVLYGYSSLVSFMPYNGIGVVILANKNNTPLPEILERYIVDNLLGLKIVDWNGRNVQLEKHRTTAEEKEIPSDENKNIQLTQNDIKKYLGKYNNSGYGTITIKTENNILVSYLRGIKCVLNFKGNDTFELYHPVEHRGWRVVFKRDNGNIVTMAIDIETGAKEIIYNKI